MPSRVAAKFAFEINDWDRVGTSTSLGGGFIDLASLEPFESSEVTLPVVHEKGDRGTFTIRMLFQPESKPCRSPCWRELSLQSSLALGKRPAPSPLLAEPSRLSAVLPSRWAKVLS